MDDQLWSVPAAGPLWASLFFLTYDACAREWRVCDVEEVTFKPTHNHQPSQRSLIIPVCNQASMAESTPTAYTPNTLTGNLFSPGAFVCSFEGQPVNTGRERSGKRQSEKQKKQNNVKV